MIEILFGCGFIALFIKVLAWIVKFAFSLIIDVVTWIFQLPFRIAETIQEHRRRRELEEAIDYVEKAGQKLIQELNKPIQYTITVSDTHNLSSERTQSKGNQNPV